MERLEPAAGFEVLRRANLSLQDFLVRSTATVQGSDDEVEQMLHLERTLLAVARELDSLQQSERDEVHVELRLYRDNLLRLRQQLAVLQHSASERRARLYVREKHLRAAQDWCASARNTG